MDRIVLTRTRIRNGVWEGVFTGMPDQPSITAIVGGIEVPDVSVQPVADQPGIWAVLVPIPSDVLNEGLQTFVIHDTATGGTLANFAIVAGDSPADDLRAEVDLLRAELDMLKSAFRRHCVETAR